MTFCGPDFVLCSPKTTPSLGAGLPLAPSTRTARSSQSRETAGAGPQVRELADATHGGQIPLVCVPPSRSALDNNCLRQLCTVSRRTRTSQIPKEGKRNA